MRSKTLCMAVVAVTVSAISAVYADCPKDGAKPLVIGPVNPQNGFPQWLQDSNGIALELCLDKTAGCVFDEVVEGNPFSTQIGFGAEAFWWLAEASVNNASSNASANIVMGAEAAFMTEAPADGRQFPFTRLRIRADLPALGTYTVDHPFGQEQFKIEAVGAGREINETIDLPFTANSPHQGKVGPFLQSTTAPSGYIGNGAPGTVTGSPCGTNLFRITGVSPTGAPLVLDGAGGNSLQTDQFTVIGKLSSGITNTPVSVERTTYAREANSSGRVDLFAKAPVGATVAVSGAANLPTVEIPLTDDGNGLFSAHVALANAATLPPVVKVTAKTATNAATTLVAPLIDQVTITQAEYDLNTKTLTVKASSSDQSTTMPPTLTVAGVGDLVNGNLGKPLPIPPAIIKVTSSAGGEDVEPISFVGTAPAAANTAPVAVNDVATVVAGIPTRLSVLVNDTDVDHDALKIVAATSGSNGNVSFTDQDLIYTANVDFMGSDTFSYTLRDVQAAEASATVTVTVSAPNTAENFTLTSAECRQSKQEWRITGTSNAPPGTVITAFAGATVANGSRIGEGATDNVGTWVIRERGSPVLCSSPVSVTSATGALLENVKVTISN
jgi:hypothetical protein